MSRRVLVTGAAGKTGRAVTAALAGAGAWVRCFAHRPEQAEPLRALGAAAVCWGDLRDRQALASALAGVDVVYHICPNMSPDEEAIGGLLVEIAEAGGTRVVYHSVLHPQVEAMPHHWRKLRVEERLRSSALDVTVLQPTAYMQNILGYWDEITTTGTYAPPYATHARVSLVDLSDVADAARVVVLEPGHEGATYELCGNDHLSQDEVAAAVGDALGRPVTAVARDRGDWRRDLAGHGTDPRVTDALEAMFVHYERYGLRGNANVLTWLLGRPPRSFAEFLQRKDD